MSDELSDLCALAALAGEYRGAIGASDSGLLADLERRARLEHSDHVYNLIRSYDFSGGTMSDLRLGKCFSIDDPLPLFDSLLLAE